MKTITLLVPDVVSDRLNEICQLNPSVTPEYVRAEFLYESIFRQEIDNLWMEFNEFIYIFEADMELQESILEFSDVLTAGSESGLMTNETYHQLLKEAVQLLSSYEHTGNNDRRAEVVAFMNIVYEDYGHEQLDLMWKNTVDLSPEELADF